MTDKIAAEVKPRRLGWFFYDGNCSLCVSVARRFEPLLARLNFATAPLQSSWARESLGRTENSPLTEMRILLPNGQTAGGADAVLLIARRTVWGWPLVFLSFLPGIKPLLRAMYRQLAARRHCLKGACSISRSADSTTNRTNHRFSLKPLASFAFRWLVMAIFVSAVFAARARMADWVFMWVLASAVFMGCKWATVARLWPAIVPSTNHRPGILAYFFLWPGMDPRPFLGRQPYREEQARRPATRGAIVKVISGAALITVTAHVATLPPLLRGWVGMLGIILLLHFGIFDLLAIALHKRGIEVEPIMRRPLFAASLADFWGHRWNTAFSQLSRDLFLNPLKRRLGVSGATLGIFVISGLLHELVISVPARGGYGLPTTYFLLQGLAVLAERSHAGKTFGLARESVRARVFVVLLAAGPAFFLFHPAFIHHVIVPMLNFIGSI
jgi:predicted DCC family thiol-disulfide oxidoreductase YuxK